MNAHHVRDPATFEKAVGRRLDGRPLAITLDVDGTLAPIAPRPQDAKVPEDTRQVLHALAGLADVRVLLVSGRAASDAAWVASVEGAWVLGNHGLELRAPDGTLSADDAVRPFEQAVSRAARALERIAESTEGAILEDKRWTLSLHYRLVDPAAVPALQAVAHEVASATGLRITEGKKVIELRPPVDVNKGTATIALADRIGALGHDASLFFAGDDRTDEDAFEALRSRKPDAVTVRVGAGEDSPIDTHAEYSVGSPADLREILRWLATRRGSLRSD